MTVRGVGWFLTVVALSLASILIVWFVAYFAFYEVCDQHGGVAADSPAGRFCESPAGWSWYTLGLVGTPVMVIAFAGAALKRWGWQRPTTIATVAVGLFVAVFIVTEPLSDDCSDADYRAYEQWGKDGSKGEPPADCESY